MLSSHSSLRAEVVPHPPPDPSASRPPPAPGDQLELLGHADSAGNSLFEAANAGAGGTCSITVTEFGTTGGVIRGTFVGHLLNHASPAVIAELTSGTFTLDAP